MTANSSRQPHGGCDRSFWRSRSRCVLQSINAAAFPCNGSVDERAFAVNHTWREIGNSPILANGTR
jgi:hypothetical protein